MGCVSSFKADTLPSCGGERYINELRGSRCKANCYHAAVQEVETVKIDRSGTYKYVLLRLQSMESAGSSRLLVRGSQQAGYHRDVVQMAQQACAGGEGQVDILLLAADLLLLTDMLAAIGITYTVHHTCAIPSGSMHAYLVGWWPITLENVTLRCSAVTYQQCHVQITCLGGGRIAFSAAEKCIKIYGYSSEYDQAPHSIAAALVRRRYPLHDVTVSYSGY